MGQVEGSEGAVGRRLDVAPRPADVLALARSIVAGRGNEISCAECRSWLSTYVEGALYPNPAWYPRIEQHLALCPSCAAACAVLCETMRRADSGSLVEPPAYPQFQVPHARATRSRTT